MASESHRPPGPVIARLARQVELAVETAGLSLPQYRVLSFLAEGGEAASALADKLAVSRPSVTGVVDGLVARGLVQRAEDPADRRRVKHDLTPAGREVIAAADAEVERRLDDIVAHRPDRAADAVAGLDAWGQALDGYRHARRAARASAPADKGAQAVAGA